jgi:hypothetical protein
LSIGAIMDGRRETHDGEGRKEEARVEEGI